MYVSEILYDWYCINAKNVSLCQSSLRQRVTALCVLLGTGSVCSGLVSFLKCIAKLWHTTYCLLIYTSWVFRILPLLLIINNGRLDAHMQIFMWKYSHDTSCLAIKGRISLAVKECISGFFVNARQIAQDCERQSREITFKYEEKNYRVMMLIWKRM